MLTTVQAEGEFHKCVRHEDFEHKPVVITYTTLFLVVGILIVFWICYQVVTIVNILEQ